MDVVTVILLIVLMGMSLLYLLRPSAKMRRITKYLDKLPGPPRYPIVGSMAEFIGLPREDFFNTTVRRTKKYGPIFKVWVGNRPTVMIYKPDHLEKIMSSQVHLTKPMAYDAAKPWLGEGLIISDGAKWHKNRKLLTPGFHFTILEQFVEIFNEKVSNLVDVLSTQTGQQFDMYPFITNCALDIICETAMGIKLNAVLGNSTEYSRSVYQVTEMILQRILRPWLFSDVVFYNTKLGKDFQKCVDNLHRYGYKVLQERKMKHTKADDVCEEDKMLGKKRRLAFLDILLNASANGAGLSDREIRQEIDTFMFAGHDTITTTACWALLLLGNHPEIQEKAREEINSIFPDGHKLTISDLNDMKYVERVLKETLRLYPSVPTIGRLLKEDLVLDKYLIPAGVAVFMQLNQVHRDPEYYTEPDKFDPDRFLPENSHDRHPYAYVPFSAGPRNCLGQKFAMYQGKTLMAWILKHYRVKAIESQETVRIYKEIVMKPQNGLQVILERI